MPEDQTAQPVPPEPLASLVDTINRHDTEGFLDAFTVDGVVDDWGREFHGRDAIRGWSDREFIGSDGTLRVTEVRTAPSEVVVVGDWRSNHANGLSAFTFSMAGDLVRQMTIRAG